jgi:heme oxygenase
MTTHHGDLTIYPGEHREMCDLTQVTGGLDVSEGATLTAPALTTTGWLAVREGATLTAPALTQVTGWLDVREGATLTAPALTRR